MYMYNDNTHFNIVTGKFTAREYDIILIYWSKTHIQIKFKLSSKHHVHSVKWRITGSCQYKFLYITLQEEQSVSANYITVLKLFHNFGWVNYRNLISFVEYDLNFKLYIYKCTFQLSNCMVYCHNYHPQNKYEQGNLKIYFLYYFPHICFPCVSPNYEVIRYVWLDELLYNVIISLNLNTNLTFEF